VHTGRRQVLVPDRGPTLSPVDDAPADDGATRLERGAEDADSLLYYAVSTGREVGGPIRDPIVRTHRAVTEG